MAQKFSRRAELHSIVVKDKPSDEAWHESIKGFGARIMRESKRTGKTLRQYLARYKDVDGKDHKDPIGTFEEITYDEAMRKAQDIVAAASHERKTGKKPLPTLGDALEFYLLERMDKLAAASIEDYRKKWQYLKKWHDENILTLNSDFWADRYIELLKIGRPTAIGVIRTAHAVYQSLVDDEKITLNPLKRVARKQEIYAHAEPKATMVRRVDLPKVWSWLETRAHVSVRDMVRMALFTGLRDAVIGGLRWENINIDEKMMLVPAEERGNKGKRLVWVPIADWVHENVVLPRWHSRLPDNPWLIPSHKKAGAPLTDIRGSMGTMKEEIGIHVNPHMLRRTFATIAAQATGNNLMASRMLTHSQKAKRSGDVPAVTAGYLITEAVEMRKAFNDTAKLILQLVEPPAKAVPTVRTTTEPA